MHLLKPESINKTQKCETLLCTKKWLVNLCVNLSSCKTCSVVPKDSELITTNTSSMPLTALLSGVNHGASSFCKLFQT